MKHHMYAIMDKLANEFSPPWVGKNDQIALRQYHYLSQTTPDFPRNDMQLFHIGTFEDGYPASFENDFYPVAYELGETNA